MQCIVKGGPALRASMFIKDSVVKQPQGMHLSEVLGALDDAEKGKREFGVIIDLR